MTTNGTYEHKDTQTLVPLTSRFIERTVVFSSNLTTEFTPDYHEKCSRWISNDILMHQMQNPGYFVVHTNTNIDIVGKIFYMTVTVTFRMEG